MENKNYEDVFGLLESDIVAQNMKKEREEREILTR